MLSLTIRGLDETIAHLEHGAGTFANDVTFRAVQELTLLSRREVQKGLGGATVDRGFWGRGSPYGGMVGVRSGDLRRSVGPGVVYRAGNTVIGAVGTNAPQMPALETGATIRPTSGTYLRIPTKFAQTSTGVDRNAGRSMRGVPGVTVHPSKTGALFLWQKVDSGLAAIAAGEKVPGTTRGVMAGAKAKGHDEVPLYLLAREVKMPEKRTFRDTAIIMQPTVQRVAGDRAALWVSHLAAV